MIGNLLSKYIWLTETIYSADGITFKEINKKWLDNELSGGIALSKRTFHKWRIAIEELFGLIIDCERKNEYCFVIQNKEQLKQDNLTGWIFKTLSTSCNFRKYKSIQNKILLEDVFTDKDLLFSILDAIRTQKTLHMIYPSNPQPIGFSGILLAKRQNSFYCTYFLHNRNVADTKSPYPIKRLEVIRWFNQKSMVFNQSLS